MSENRNDEARDWWWGVMLSAFGCPGLEDEASREHMRQSDPLRDLTSLDIDGRVAGDAIIDTGLDLASAGALDQLIRIDPEEYLVAALDTEDALYAQAKARGWPDVADTETQVRLRKVTNEFLQRLVREGQEGI